MNQVGDKLVIFYCRKKFALDKILWFLKDSAYRRRVQVNFSEKSRLLFKKELISQRRFYNINIMKNKSVGEEGKYI